MGRVSPVIESSVTAGKQLGEILHGRRRPASLSPYRATNHTGLSKPGRKNSQEILLERTCGPVADRQYVFSLASTNTSIFQIQLICLSNVTSLVR